jgi:hypothetical protein
MARYTMADLYEDDPDAAHAAAVHFLRSRLAHGPASQLALLRAARQAGIPPGAFVAAALALDLRVSGTLSRRVWHLPKP